MDKILVVLGLMLGFSGAMVTQPQFDSPTQMKVEIAEEEEVVVTEELVELPLCSTSSFKSYMDYKKITNKESKQYKFIKDNMLVSMDTGLLHLKDDTDYIGVALGSYFGPIGTKLQFTLSSGEVMKVVIIERKADKHVTNGCQHKVDKSVIEIVVDGYYAKHYFGMGANGYILSGNFNNSERFNGTLEAVHVVKTLD